MTAQIAAYGRLVADVQSKTTSNGNAMTFGRMVVSMPCHNTENGEAPFWLGVVAFGKQAEALARHGKGELISVSGTMQINQWTAKVAAGKACLRQYQSFWPENATPPAAACLPWTQRGGGRSSWVKA